MKPAVFVVSLTACLLSLSGACSDDEEGGSKLDGGRPGALDAGPRVDGGDAARDSDGGLTCNVAIDLAAELLYADPTLRSLRACDTDDDCGALALDFQCAEPVFVRAFFCAIPLARSGFDAGTERLREYERELCPQVTGPLGCGRIPTCNPVVPICRDNLCTHRSDGLAADGGQL